MEQVIRDALMVLAIIGMFAGLIAGAWLALRWMFGNIAKQDGGGIVTFRRDGECVAITKGPEGEPVKFILSVAGYRMDPEGWDVIPDTDEHYVAHLTRLHDIRSRTDPTFVERKLKTNPDGTLILDSSGKAELVDGLSEKIRRANKKSIFEKIFKVVFVGFTPYQVFGYKLRWTKWGETDALTGDVGMHKRSETVFSVIFRYTQYGVTVVAETGAGSLAQLAAEYNATISDEKQRITIAESVKVKLELVFEIVLINPRKALFRTGGAKTSGLYVEAIATSILNGVRGLINESSWDTLISDPEALEGDIEEVRHRVNGREDNWEPLTDENGNVITVNGSAMDDYGFWVAKIRPLNPDLADPELQKAIEKIFMAKQDRASRMIAAEAVEREASAPLVGQATGYAKIAAVHGGAGTRMKIAEHIGKIKVLTLNSGGGGGMGPIVSLTDSFLEEEAEPENTGEGTSRSETPPVNPPDTTSQPPAVTPQPSQIPSQQQYPQGGKRRKNRRRGKGNP